MTIRVSINFKPLLTVLAVIGFIATVILAPVLAVFLLIGILGEMEKDDKFWSYKTMWWSFLMGTVLAVSRLVGSVTLDALPDPSATAIQIRIMIALAVGLVYCIVKQTKFQEKKYPYMAGLWGLLWNFGWTLTVFGIMQWIGSLTA